MNELDEAIIIVGGILLVIGLATLAYAHYQEKKQQDKKSSNAL